MRNKHSRGGVKFVNVDSVEAKVTNQNIAIRRVDDNLVLEIRK
jgi:hypothetical protein